MKRTVVFAVLLLCAEMCNGALLFTTATVSTPVGNDSQSGSTVADASVLYQDPFVMGQMTPSLFVNATADAKAGYGAVQVSAGAQAECHGLQCPSISATASATASFQDSLVFSTGLGGGFVSFEYVAGHGGFSGGCCMPGAFSFSLGTQTGSSSAGLVNGFGATALQPFQDLVPIVISGTVSILVGTQNGSPGESGSAGFSLISINLFDADKKPLTTFQYLSGSASEYSVVSDLSAVPEPATLALGAIGLIGILAAKRKRA